MIEAGSWADPQRSARIIGFITSKVMRRLKAAGASQMSADDVTNELWVGWCVARDGYNSDLGVPFEAYLYRGLINHINRAIEKFIERSKDQNTYAISLDTPTGENEDTSLHDIIGSGERLPEDIVTERIDFERLIEPLSQDAKIFIRLLENIPEELGIEVERLRQKAEFGRRMGIRRGVSMRVSSDLVFDLMGLNPTERCKILREIRMISERSDK